MVAQWLAVLSHTSDTRVGVYAMVPCVEFACSLNVVVGLPLCALITLHKNMQSLIGVTKLVIGLTVSCLAP